MKIGDGVLVDMTNLPGWERYQHCHLEGRVEFVFTDNAALVALLGFAKEDREIKVSIQRLQWRRRRRAIAKARQRGDHVYVLTVTNGVREWWGATVVGRVSKIGDTYRVRWDGEYEKYADTAVVSNKALASCLY